MNGRTSNFHKLGVCGFMIRFWWKCESESKSLFSVISSSHFFIFLILKKLFCRKQIKKSHHFSKISLAPPSGYYLYSVCRSCVELVHQLELSRNSFKHPTGCEPDVIRVTVLRLWNRICLSDRNFTRFLSSRCWFLSFCNISAWNICRNTII